MRARQGCPHLDLEAYATAHEKTIEAIKCDMTESTQRHTAKDSGRVEQLALGPLRHDPLLVEAMRDYGYIASSYHERT